MSVVQGIGPLEDPRGGWLFLMSEVPGARVALLPLLRQHELGGMV